jgi:hypothetical protein
METNRLFDELLQNNVLLDSIDRRLVFPISKQDYPGHGSYGIPLDMVDFALGYINDRLRCRNLHFTWKEMQLNRPSSILIDFDGYTKNQSEAISAFSRLSKLVANTIFNLLDPTDAKWPRHMYIALLTRNTLDSKREKDGVSYYKIGIHLHVYGPMLSYSHRKYILNACISAIDNNQKVKTFMGKFYDDKLNIIPISKVVDKGVCNNTMCLYGGSKYKDKKYSIPYQLCEIKKYIQNGVDLKIPKPITIQLGDANPVFELAFTNTAARVLIRYDAVLRQDIYIPEEHEIVEQKSDVNNLVETDDNANLVRHLLSILTDDYYMHGSNLKRRYIMRLVANIDERYYPLFTEFSARETNEESVAHRKVTESRDAWYASRSGDLRMDRDHALNALKSIARICNPEQYAEYLNSCADNAFISRVYADKIMKKISSFDLARYMVERGITLNLRSSVANYYVFIPDDPTCSATVDIRLRGKWKVIPRSNKTKGDTDINRCLMRFKPYIHDICTKMHSYSQRILAMEEDEDSAKRKSRGGDFKFNMMQKLYNTAFDTTTSLKNITGALDNYMKDDRIDDDMDAAEYLVGVYGGVVDITKMEMVSDARAVYVTKCAECAFIKYINPDNLTIEEINRQSIYAQGGIFDTTLEFILASFTSYGDFEMFMHVISGGIYGGEKDPHHMFLYGLGSNAKSVLLGLFKRTMGKGYAITAQSSLLTTPMPSPDKANPALCTYDNARSAFMQEISKYATIQTEPYKIFAGGPSDEHAVRQLYGQTKPIKINTTNAIAVNEKPGFQSVGDADIRRTIMLHMKIQYLPNPDVNNKYHRKKNESKVHIIKDARVRAAIFTMMCEYFQSFYHNYKISHQNIHAPDCSKFTMEHLESNNHIVKFMRERMIITGTSQRTQSIEIASNIYAQWYERNVRSLGRNERTLPRDELLRNDTINKYFQEWEDDGCVYLFGCRFREVGGSLGPDEHIYGNVSDNGNRSIEYTGPNYTKYVPLQYHRHIIDKHFGIYPNFDHINNSDAKWPDMNNYNLDRESYEEAKRHNMIHRRPAAIPKQL